MLNRVILVGRLTKDPDLRYTGEGTAVANFTVAVNRPFKQNGEQQADFINCVVWRKPAENLANYMSKGSLIGVDGRIQTRSYEQDNKRVFVTEVVADSVQFLESKNNSSQANNGQGNTNTSNNQQNASQGTQNKNDNPFQGDAEPIDISSDDLPF